MDTVSITIPRSIATPLGILKRETSAEILNPAHISWLKRNIETRMNRRQRIALAERLRQAGVTLH